MQHQAKAKETRSTNIDFPTGVPIGIWKPAKLPPNLPAACLQTEERAKAPLPGTPLPAPLRPSRGGRMCDGPERGDGFFGGGGDDVSSASLGRMGCLRAGAGQILYFGGGKGIGK